MTPAVTAKDVTVYRAQNGRTYLRKHDAYMATARAMVETQCAFNHGFRWDLTEINKLGHRITCKLCELRCIHGHKQKADWGMTFMEPWEDCDNWAHTYRHKLTRRLARWLRWRDERCASTR